MVTLRVEKLIAAALITSISVLIAVCIGCSNRVAYTGKIKEAKSLKPISNASVAITEDQKVPQRFTTDSEGVFFAQLSKDTQTMLLEVKADGYQFYSRRGPTVRTGSEDIFLEPLSPPPLIAQPDPSEIELDNLRNAHNVSLIRPEEEDKPPAEIPKNSYGFILGIALTTDPVVELRVLDGHLGGFEIHKLADGHVELVGFVGAETFSSYRMGFKAQDKITLYSATWSDAHYLVSMPLRSLVCPQSRDIKVDKGKEIEVLDCSFTGHRTTVSESHRQAVDRERPNGKSAVMNDVQTEEALVKDAQLDWRTGNRSEAVKEFTKASQLNPNDYLPHKCLGYNYASSRDFEHAAIEYERALHAQNAPAEIERQVKLLNDNRKAVEEALERVRSSSDTQANFDLQMLLFKLAPVGAMPSENECAEAPGKEDECHRARVELADLRLRNPSYGSKDCAGNAAAN